MPKKRSKSGEEFYRGLVRELQKENRQLHKRIRQLEKQEHMFEEAIISDEPLVFEVAPLEQTCTDCGKGKLKEFSVLDRIFVECNVCSFRKKIGGPK